MSKWPAEKLEALIQRGYAGILTPKEQIELAVECSILRASAMKMERAIHDLVKETEKHDQQSIERRPQWP